MTPTLKSRDRNLGFEPSRKVMPFIHRSFLATIIIYISLSFLATSNPLVNAQECEERQGSGHEWYHYVIIPFVSGAVGWFTNVVALKMTFYPIQFFGIPFLLIKNQPFGLFGWQGIIPSKSGKMAGIAVDLMVKKLIDVKKVFQRLDAREMARVLESGMRESMTGLVERAALRHMPEVWPHVPPHVRTQVLEHVLDSVPDFFIGLLADIQDNIYDVFDIRDFAIRKMTMDKRLTNDIFLKCGHKEFKFIEFSGLVIGFFFGMIQSAVYHFYDRDWVLPAAGFIVGFATNAIALKMIFEPVEPVFVCGRRIQGLFLQRQDEVAEVFAEMSAQQIFTAERMWREILYGPLAPAFEETVRRHALLTTRRLMQGLETYVSLVLSPHALKCELDRLADDIIRDIPMTISLGYDYTEKTLGLEEEIRDKLKGLPSDEFEGVLHPVFQEDEIKLILVGAILGMGVGIAQIYAFQSV